MNKKIEIFEKLSVPKAVASLALPTVLSMLVTVVYNMVDTYFVGQTGDPNQVAAVSIVMPLFMVLMSIGNIFGIGGTSLISRVLGEGDKKKVKSISSFCFYSAIVFGIVMIGVFLIGMPVLLKLIGASDHTWTFASNYLTWISIGAPLIILSIALSNIIRSEGAAKAAMIGMVLGTVTNIILDPIMILALNMGVTGAAIATVIGNLVTVVFYILYILMGESILSISPKDFRVSDGILKEVFLIGLPASLNNLLMSAASIFLNNFLVSYGDVPVAAMGVAMKANMLVFMLQIGIAMGVQPLIGYNYGSGNIKRMKAVISFSILCTVMIGTILTVIYYFTAEEIIKVFISDLSVIEYGVPMLRALMTIGPFIGILFVFMSTFQAMGKAIPALILSLSRQGLVFIPALYLSNYLLGLNGIIYAQPIADIASIVMALLLFLFIKKKLQTNLPDKSENEITNCIE